MSISEAASEDSQVLATSDLQLPKWHHESAQGAVAASESTFEVIFNGVLDFLFLIGVEAGPHFRCLKVNPSYVKATGRTQEQMRGKLIEEILPPEQARFTIAKYTEAVQTRRPIMFEESAEVPAGELIVETTLTPVFDAEGNCTHLLGDSRDITERRRIMQVLQESETLYRNLFENARDALATFTLDGEITAVNRAAEQLLGYSRAELIGQHMSKVGTPASVALAAERTRDFLAGKRLPSPAFESELVHKDGRIMTVESRINIVRSTAGEPIGFQGIFRDITERRRAEEALQQAHTELERRVQERTAELQRANETLQAEIEERKRVEAALRAAEEDYRALFENAVEGIYRSSLDGKQLRANPALVKLNGYSSEAEQIAGVNDIATEWYVDPYRRAEFARILEEQGTVTDFESEIYRHKTREQIWISETARLVRAPDGTPLYYEGTVQDITAYKQAEEMLRALNESLEQRVVERTVELTQTVDALWREIDRRTRTEEALRESEQRYRDLFENANDMITTLTLDGTFTSVNKQAEIILGYSREELIGKDSHTIATLASAALGDDRTRRVLAKEWVSPVFEIEVICKGGRTVPLEARVRFIRGKNGIPVGFQGIYRDITERKNAERALRESEEHYRAVVDMQTELVCRFRPDTTLTFVNEAYCRYFGKTREELLNTSFLSLIPEHARPAAKAHIDSLTAYPRLVVDEHEVIAAGGDVRWQRWTDQAIFADTGQLIEFQSTGVDITERKQAEEALDQSQQQVRRQFEQLQAIYQTAPVGLCFLSTTLRFVNINTRLAEMAGLSRVTPIGRPVRDVWPTLADKLEPICQQVIKTGKPVLDTEIDDRISMPPRGECVWHVNSFPVKNADGAIVGVNVVILDITERKHAEEALQRAQTELAHVTRVTTLGEMTASIAHEVNQPLGAIVGNADVCLRWLAGEAPDLEQVREALSDIVKDGHRASEVIARIRALVKKETLQKTRLDINEVIGEAVALASPEAQRKRIRMQTERATDLPSVLGDRVQLRQVILNLIMNGIEAMTGVEETARDLVLRSSRDGKQTVRISVQDCGVGLDPQETKRIFAPFHTTKPGGMGMGLAICRSIVEAHGGRLWTTPNPGPGATFQFTLPCDSEGVR
jgi:PAS domain S-box-containing protein